MIQKSSGESYYNAYKISLPIAQIGFIILFITDNSAPINRAFGILVREVPSSILPVRERRDAFIVVITKQTKDPCKKEKEKNQ